MELSRDFPSSAYSQNYYSSPVRETENLIIAFQLKKISLAGGDIGLVAGQGPSFDFNKSPRNTSDVIDIKIKLKNTQNPNYIKQLGATQIPMSKLSCCLMTQTLWVDLFESNNKGQPIGKLKLQAYLEPSRSKSLIFKQDAYEPASAVSERYEMVTRQRSVSMTNLRIPVRTPTTNNNKVDTTTNTKK